MTQSDALSFLIVVTCFVIIANGMAAYYLTADMITFMSQATIYPPVTVMYSEFNGTTTNFSAFDEDALKSVTNLTLEAQGIAKVVFDGAVDLAQDKDIHNVIDIDANAQFSPDLVEIDTGTLQSLRTSASVFIHGLSFSSPEILVDGYPCPPTLCQLVDYSNGTIVFRVNQFSRSYSVREEEAYVPTQPPGGGASYPSQAVPFSNFTVDREFIKASVRQGETYLDSVTIENTGDADLNLTMEAEGMGSMVSLSEDSFSLAAGKSKKVTVAFTVLESGAPEVYTGRLRIRSGSIERVVVLIVEVKEKRALFDIYLSLDDVPVEASPGSEVEADILLYNFGDLMPVDVSLYYSLRDFDGNEILYKHDTLAVEEQAELKRRIRLPDDLEEGFYVFYSRVEYGDQAASSSGIIKVVKGKAPAGALPGFGWAVILAAVIIAVTAGILIALRKPGYRERIRGGRVHDSHAVEKLRIARLSRQNAEKAAEERRLERLEAERRAEAERKERELLEKRLEAERRKRGALSERLRKKRSGKV